jgi:hypothetical protein
VRILDVQTPLQQTTEEGFRQSGTPWRERGVEWTLARIFRLIYAVALINRVGAMRDRDGESMGAAREFLRRVMRALFRDDFGRIRQDALAVGIDDDREFETMTFRDVADFDVFPALGNHFECVR